jgi:hypothetical protein
MEQSKAMECESRKASSDVLKLIFALLISTQDDTEFYLSVMKVGIMSISALKWLWNSLSVLINGHMEYFLLV